MKKIISLVLSLLIVFSPITTLAKVNSDGEKITSPKTTKTLKATAQPDIKVNVHFYVWDANGVYFESGKAYTKTIKDGDSPIRVYLPTYASRVTVNPVVKDGKEYIFSSNAWKDENGNPTSGSWFEIPYADAQAAAGASNVADINLYAVYRPNIKVTLHFTDIRHANGTTEERTQSNTISPGGGWSFPKSKLESTTGVVSGSKFSFCGYEYAYTGEWIEGGSNVIDGNSSIRIYNSAGTSSGNTYYLDDDMDLYFKPVYSQRMLQGLEYKYIDNISTGSGSWSNKDAFGYMSQFNSLTHTFSNPEDKTPVDHYEFMYWKDDGKGTIYNAGDSFTYSVNSGLPEGTVTTVTMHAIWQPSVRLIYNDNEEISEVESFKNVTVEKEPNTPEGYKFLGWFDDNGIEVSGNTYTAPEPTYEADSAVVINVTAKYELISVPDEPISSNTSKKTLKETKTLFNNNPELGVVVPLGAITPQRLNPNTPISPIAPNPLVKKDEGVIKDTSTPLTAPEGKWALINLICAIITTILGLIMIIKKLFKKENKKKNEKKIKKYKLLPMLFGIIISIGSIFLFLITEDMSLPMALIDEYTLIMIVFLIVNIVMFLVQPKKKTEEVKDDEE